jgi:Fe-S-cluster formation regulator IscX/YfhJ
MLREFNDKSGVAWRVWDVNPDAWPQKVQFADLDRRSTRLPGWLCFESQSERRRFSPIPEDWESLDDHALSKLCERAEVVPPLAKRLDFTEPSSQ